MPRPKIPTPSYLLHKKSGQARVRLKNGSRYRDVYLGEYVSPESLEKYHRVLAEYVGENGQDRPEPELLANPDDWTVAELAVKYDDFASSYYVKNGEPTNDRYTVSATSPTKKPDVAGDTGFRVFPLVCGRVSQARWRRGQCIRRLIGESAYAFAFARITWPTRNH